MYFLVSAAHWAAVEEAEDVAALEVLVPVPVPEVFGTLTVVRVEAELAAAAAASLLLTTTAAAVEDELTFAELELVLEAELVLDLEVPLELAFVLRVVETAEELVFGVLEEALEAKEAALELAFWLELEATLEADFA